jgi:hypothetical protein
MGVRSCRVEAPPRTARVTFALPDGLAPEVYPLAWLVGEWRGAGVVEYPGIPRFDFEQRIVFDHDGGPYLRYTSVISTRGERSEEGAVWASETGFWRVPPEAPDDPALAEGQRPVEALLADAAGVLSLYVGEVGNGRIDLATDVMAHTPSGADMAGATRMYGLVDGDLLWAWDLAAFGHSLRSYASARLVRATP